MMRQFGEVSIDILPIDLLQPVSDLAVNPNAAVGIEFFVHRFADERVRESVATMPSAVTMPALEASSKRRCASSTETSATL